MVVKITDELEEVGLGVENEEVQAPTEGEKVVMLSDVKIEGEEDSEKQLLKAKQEGVLKEAKQTITKVSAEFTKALYTEFSSFLEDKIDLVPDEGVKIAIPTGIDVLDAALG